jgi:hypothetical protein
MEKKHELSQRAPKGLLGLWRKEISERMNPLNSCGYCFEFNRQSPLSPILMPMQLRKKGKKVFLIF